LLWRSLGVSMRTSKERCNHKNKQRASQG